MLIVFPHADDEAVTCAGTIRRLADVGAVTTLALLTAGERGNPEGVPDPALKGIRTREARLASRRLKVGRLLQQDFGDGRLAERRDEVVRWLAATMNADPYDLLITYDAAGLDGHPDHIACSRIVTDVRAARANRPALWYVALPRWLLAALRRVGQMRTDRDLDASRAWPTHRIFTGGVSPIKMAALREYRSQRKAIGKGAGRVVPAWLALGLQPFEYFSRVP